jgi:hypothetical protein
LEGVWHGGVFFGEKRSSQYRDLPSLEHSQLGIEEMYSSITAITTPKKEKNKNRAI